MRQRLEDLGRILEKCHEVLEYKIFEFPRFEDQFYEYFTPSNKELQFERMCDLKNCITTLERWVIDVIEIAEGADYLNDDLYKLIDNPIK